MTKALSFSKPPPSQVQASKLGQPAKAPTLFEVPEWVTRLVAFDRRYSKWVHESLLTDRTFTFLRFFEFSGDGLFWLPGTAAFWLSPSWGSADTRMFALNLFISLLLDLFVVGCIKSAVQRKRPRYSREHLVVVSMDQWSFPSGHSTRAMMIVTLVWMYTPMWQAMIKQSWWPYLVARYENSYFVSQYVLPCVEHRLLSIAHHVLNVWLAAATASRVILGRHYILDVLGGLSVCLRPPLPIFACMCLSMSRTCNMPILSLALACMRISSGGFSTAGGFSPIIIATWMLMCTTMTISLFESVLPQHLQNI